MNRSRTTAETYQWLPVLPADGRARAKHKGPPRERDGPLPKGVEAFANQSWEGSNGASASKLSNAMFVRIENDARLFCRWA